MSLQLLIYLFYAGIALTTFNVLLVSFKKQSFTQYTIYLKLLLSISTYIGVYLLSGHLPVYDKLATLQNIVLIVILLSIFYNNPRKTNNINIVWYVILILELLVFTEELSISGDYYMYDKAYVILFFQLRITSMGLFVFAIVNLIASLLKNNDITVQDDLIHRARNYTILGAIIFLSGEFSGSYWCFLWWGDPWHWSKGFFAASVIFMLSMLGCHLPFKLANTREKRAAYSLIALCLILTTYLLPH